MKYYYMLLEDDKIIQLGWIRGRENAGVRITEDDYIFLTNLYTNKPTALEGYDYLLKTDLTWELYELPVVEEELTAEEALDIILGGAV